MLNFLAPALGVAAITAALAKLFWRAELRSVRWVRLALWAGSASTAALVLGLVVFGRDGRMATYAAMVVACAVGTWWAGFRRA